MSAVIILFGLSLVILLIEKSIDVNAINGLLLQEKINISLSSLSNDLLFNFIMLSFLVLFIVNIYINKAYLNRFNMYLFIAAYFYFIFKISIVIYNYLMSSGVVIDYSYFVSLLVLYISFFVSYSFLIRKHSENTISNISLWIRNKICKEEVSKKRGGYQTKNIDIQKIY